MPRQESSSKRVLSHVGIFVLGLLLSAVVGTFALGLSTRDFGLLLTAFAITVIFFFELVYQHNVRIRRIPEDRAETLRILMLPMVYLAVLGLTTPILVTPAGDPTAGIVAISIFLALVPLTVAWAIVRERRKRRARRAEGLIGIPRVR